MMEKKIVLDNKSFKALSAESRINILKKLTNRRMTLAELSKKLSLKTSTIKEHCELLINADLIKKIDDGRKWKYYELTKKGKQITTPNFLEETRILIMLSISAIIFSIIILSLMQGFFMPTNYNMRYSETSELGILTNDVGIESIDQTTTIIGINYNFYSISVMFALIIGIFVGWFVGKKA
jgi:DNA-binding transcriptional ArsR family regulator